MVTTEKRGNLGQYVEEILCGEIGEALEQAVPRSWGCPIPGSIQGDIGWDSEQLGLVKGAPAYSRGFEVR